MANKMLIDATHPEETRVVVLRGNRVEEFDFETAHRKQLRGNIYLAKVTRVEPSLQAAFVEYGGNRHGFLAFSEIHPDYYQIPVADRQRLLDLQAEQARLEDEEDDLELALNQTVAANSEGAALAEPEDAAPPLAVAEPWAQADLPRLLAPVEPEPATPVADLVAEAAAADPSAQIEAEAAVEEHTAEEHSVAEHNGTENSGMERNGTEPWAIAALPALIVAEPSISAAEPAFADDEQPDSGDDLDIFGAIPEEAPPETIGGDADSDSENGDERPERRIPPRFLRNYHIQEVIHRRQILLVQVVKEERGTKGAALTTYLSLAGRFSVLMPNSPRGGGISRKITSAADRRRLKEIMVELDIPKGMGLIVRTAGAQRPKPEIKRDCEYLLRLWDDIREHTLKSIAPALIYEEASLIKRAIRDVYSRDIDDITVDGEDSWRAAHEFMRMLMPSHARKVHLWPDQGQSLFARFQVEAQLDAMLQPTVQLRSGGYLVINQAEALVAIDVNSGRSTRERNVEETALRTNLEAADEVARQLRLRDLAGLIVIDLIDMESKRHNAMVERRLKEALRDDRARIQVGHISHFGLLEMSRQRLRPSLEETTLIICPHCNGTGHVRGTESAALHVLRGVEEEAGKRRSAEIIVHVAVAIALYILNHKRERLNEIERRYGMRVIIAADDSMIAPRFRIERLRTLAPGEEPRFVTPDAPRTAVVPAPVSGAGYVMPAEPVDVEEDEDSAEFEADEADARTAAANGEDTEESREAERRRRRRRRRRGGREEKPRVSDNVSAPDQTFEPVTVVEPVDTAPEPMAEPVSGPAGGDDEAARRRSRRGRRGRGRDGDLSPLGVPGAEQPDLVPAYAGPTPADPFGSGHVFDIFDVMEQAELNAAQASRPPASRRGAGSRSRWQPPHWAVAGQPPMLVGEPAAADRPERAPAMESWALPSRPFMLRRDRHAPRWSQNRGAPARAPSNGTVVPEATEPAGLRARPVPIEAGPPPTPEPVALPVVDQQIHQTADVAPPAVEAAPEVAVVAEPDALAELSSEAAAEPSLVAEASESVAPERQLDDAPPVPANDVVSGPLVQPIVIGSESTPPLERKRGWWRRR
ncbi:MAG TPA: Rne/Rng family ribonuclease [Acetobacteraceae bacterium]|nr:Rne/Rng family ribonuclease [Acetobacteraceae bacterium]